VSTIRGSIVACSRALVLLRRQSRPFAPAAADASAAGASAANAAATGPDADDAGCCYTAVDCTAAQWVRAGQAELVAAFCAAATQCLVLANAPPPHDTFGGGFQRRMTIMKKSWAKEQLG
jgi:hypothetical protein